MLTIVVKPKQFWNEKDEMFIYTKECTFTIEHSLVSLSKWESKWKKPFIAKEEKTKEELLDYIRCMTLTQNIDPQVYKLLTNENIKEITDYMEEPMTATWFSENKNGPKKPPSREVITSEIIYFWMIEYNIPSEYQKWHLNRLMTLIRVCNVKKNGSSKKQSKRETLSNQAALNAARKKKLNTSG